MTTPKQFADRLKRNITTKVGLRRIFDANALREIGALIVDEMKTGIAQGKSPISGDGAFPAYKNPKKYPGKRKPARPVNLELTGEQLSALKYRINQAKIAVTIYYATKKAQLKELGHREGANDQPERPTIPDASEDLSQPIRRKVQSLIYRLIRQASLTWKS